MLEDRLSITTPMQGIEINWPFGDGEFTKWMKDAISGFSEDSSKGAANATGDFAEDLIVHIITPPMPESAATYVPGVEANPMWAGYFDKFIHMNEGLTDLMVGFFGLFFLIYLIGFGLGWVGEGNAIKSIFTLTLGFIALVANRQLLDLVWATAYVFTDWIIRFPLLPGESPGSDVTEAFVVAITSFAVGAGAASVYSGGTVALGLAIILIPVFIIIIFLLCCLFAVNLIAMVTYGVAPLIVFMTVVANVFPAAKGVANKISGFFVPTVYMSIPLAFVFRVGAVFLAETEDESIGVVGFVAESTYEGAIAPFLALGIILIGSYVVLKNFQAGSMVVGGASKAIIGGATVGVAAMTGGAGAAAKGFAKRGMKGAAANTFANTVGDSGGASGFGGDEGEPDVEQSSGGIMDRFSDFNAAAKNKEGQLMQGVKNRVPMTGGGPELSPEDRVDRLTAPEEGALGDTNTDPEMGLDNWNKNFSDAKSNIKNGDVELDDIAEKMIDAQIDQLGLDESRAETFRDTQNSMLESSRDQEHPFKSRGVTDSEAFSEWTDTEFDQETLSVMGMAGTLENGEPTAGQSVTSNLDSALSNSTARREFQSNPMAGMTSGDTDEYGSEYVSFGGPDEDNEKGRRAGYSTSPTSQASHSSPEGITMNAAENGMVEYEFDPSAIPDDMPDNHPFLDAEMTDRGTFVMSADEMSNSMDALPMDDASVTGDRESAILIEEAKKRDERMKQSSLRQATGDGPSFDDRLQQLLDPNTLAEDMEETPWVRNDQSSTEEAEIERDTPDTMGVTQASERSVQTDVPKAENDVGGQVDQIEVSAKTIERDLDPSAGRDKTAGVYRGGPNGLTQIGTSEAYPGVYSGAELGGRMPQATNNGIMYDIDGTTSSGFGNASTAAFLNQDIQTMAPSGGVDRMDTTAGWENGSFTMGQVDDVDPSTLMERNDDIEGLLNDISRQKEASSVMQSPLENDMERKTAELTKKMREAKFEKKQMDKKTNRRKALKFGGSLTAD